MFDILPFFLCSLLVHIYPQFVPYRSKVEFLELFHVFEDFVPFSENQEKKKSLYIYIYIERELITNRLRMIKVYK